MNLKHCSSSKINKMLIVVRAKAFFPDHASTGTPQSCTTLPLWFPFALNVHSRDGPLSIYTFHQYSDNRSWDQSKPAMESQETFFRGISLQANQRVLCIRCWWLLHLESRPGLVVFWKTTRPLLNTWTGTDLLFICFTWAWIVSDSYFMPWFVCLDVKDFECIQV